MKRILIAVLVALTLAVQGTSLAHAAKPDDTGNGGVSTMGANF